MSSVWGSPVCPKTCKAFTCIMSIHLTFKTFISFVLLSNEEARFQKGWTAWPKLVDQVNRGYTASKSRLNPCLSAWIIPDLNRWPHWLHEHTESQFRQDWVTLQAIQSITLPRIHLNLCPPTKQSYLPNKLLHFLQDTVMYHLLYEAFPPPQIWVSHLVYLFTCTCLPQNCELLEDKVGLIARITTTQCRAKHTGCI